MLENINTEQLVSSDDVRWTYVPLDTWKEQVKSGEAPTHVQLRKAITFEKAEEVEGEPDTVRIVITTDEKDRQNDVIETAGWSIQDFLKNPIVAFAHSYSDPPVGRSPRLELQPHRLVGFPEFTPKDLYPFGYMIGQMVRQGFLNAASVGFAPLQWRLDEELSGIRFFAQSLLEFSIVPIPANAGALVEARALGIDVHPLKTWAERVLDDYHATEGLWVPRADLELAYVTLNDGKLISIPSTEVILKSGRVLSAKNEGSVRQAIGAIEAGIQQLQSVLAQLPAVDEPEVDAAAPVTEALPAVQHLDGEYVELADESDHDQLIDINRDELAALIREAVRPSIMAVTGRLD